MQNAAPPIVLEVPTAQTGQDDEPELGLYLPAAQGKHAEEETLPMLGLNLPFGHETQDAGATAKVPAGQEVEL